MCTTAVAVGLPCGPACIAVPLRAKGFDSFVVTYRRVDGSSEHAPLVPHFPHFRQKGAHSPANPLHPWYYKKQISSEHLSKQEKNAPKAIRHTWHTSNLNKCISILISFHHAKNKDRSEKCITFHQGPVGNYWVSHGVTQITLISRHLCGCQ